MSRSTKPELLSDEPPIGCTLDAGSIPARLDEWNDLLGVVTARTAIPGGLRLEIHPELPVETVARLAGAEQECCRFLSFSVTIDGRGLGLEVRAPDDARPLVDAVFGVPA